MPVSISHLVTLSRPADVPINRRYPSSTCPAPSSTFSICCTSLRIRSFMLIGVVSFIVVSVPSPSSAPDRSACAIPTGNGSTVYEAKELVKELSRSRYQKLRIAIFRSFPDIIHRGNCTCFVFDNCYRQCDSLTKEINFRR